MNAELVTKPIPVDKLDHHVLLAFFRGTGNPIYAWACYRAARRSGKPVPEEILVYLDSVADGIVAMADNPPDPKRIPDASVKALGLSSGGPGRGGSAFTHYAHDRTGLKADMDVAIEAYRQIKEWGDGHQQDVFVSVGEKFGIDASTVRRKYKAFLEWGLFREGDI